MEGFHEGYEYFAERSADYVAVSDSAHWIDEINRSLGDMQQHLERFANDKRTLDSLGGTVAEWWHADTFNLDAVIKDVKDKAHVLESNGLGSVDVQLDSGKQASLKYYYDAKASLKAQAVTMGEKASSGSAGAAHAIESGAADGNSLLYGRMDRIIPADQLDAAKDAAQKKIAKEIENRPEQARRYEKVKELLADRLDNDKGVESKGLSKDASRQLAKDAKSGNVDLDKYGISKQQLIAFEDVMRKSLKAGMTAAIIAAALAAAPTILEAIDYLAKTGELDIEKLKLSGENALTAGSKGFLTGTMSAAIVGSAGSGLLGNALESIDPGAIGAIAVVLVNTVCNSVKVASGEMTRAEMIDAFARDSFVASVAVLAGGVSQALMPELPVLGYLIGSFVGSATAGIAYGVGKKAAIALCVEHGFTLFGLVEQNYELPDSVLEEIGVEVFDYERFMIDEFEPDLFEFDMLVIDQLQFDRFELTPLRRGVISVASVGYVGA